MTPPAAILLDVMGTLVYDPYPVEVPDALGLSFDDLLASKHPTAWMEFERGELDEANFLARFFADGRSFDGPGMKRRMAESYRWLEGMEHLLAELRDAGRPLYALSNYPIWYELIEERLRLSRFLEWRFVSCHTGIRKPRPEAYLGAAASLDLLPARCLFVDDREANCAGAEAVGMPALRFESAARLRRDLVNLDALTGRS